MSISVAAVVATLHVAAVILRHRRCSSCRSSSSHDLSVYKVHFERRLVSLGGLLIIPQCGRETRLNKTLKYVSSRFRKHRI